MSIFWMYESIFSVEIMAIDFQHKIDVQTNQKLCVIAWACEQRYTLFFVNSSLLSAFNEWGRVA